MWLLATLLAYAIARKIARLWQHPLSNPLLISLLLLILLLIVSKTDYQEYYEQNKIIHFMLGPGIIALAYPLYESLQIIKKNWKIILTACFCASISSSFLGAFIAFATGSDLNIIASVLPKSISTPFAISTAENIGGIPAVTASLVIVAGLFGPLIGYPVLNWLKIRKPFAKGLSIGAVSHAIGTAKAIENSYLEGAMSSLSLVLCGIISSIFAPLIFTAFQLFIK